MFQPIFRSLSVHAASRLQLWLLVVALLLVGGVSGWTISQTRINGPLYEDISASKQLIIDVLPPPLYIVEPYLTTIQLAFAHPEAQAGLQKKLLQQIDEYQQTLAHWRGQKLPKELHDELLVRSAPPALQFLGMVEQELIPAVNQQDSAAVRALMPRLDELFTRHRASITRIVEQAGANARAVEEQANQALWQQVGLLVVVAVVVLLCALWLSSVLTGRITGRVRQAVEAANRVAQGDIETAVDDSAADEIGQILRALENMRGALLHQLGTLSRQRHELAQQGEQLVVAKQRAERADLLKSEFIANMSHELRTPLNGILGMLEVLKFGELDQDQHESVETAYTSARELFVLIDDMLFYANLRAGHGAQRQAPFVVADVFSSLTRRFQPLAVGKGLSFQMDVSGQVPELLLGQASYLERALAVLLDNAVKFTRQGSVVLHVAMPRPMSAQGEVELVCQVQDTGCGLPPERLDNLFELFVQQDGSFTRAHGGTGLGLALAQALVDAMGGEISGGNQVSGGACFTLKLPFVAETEMAEA